MRKITVSSLILLASSLFANEIVYSSKVNNLYNSSDLNKIEGRLLPTSKVTILEKINDSVKIEIEGFMRENIRSAVYFVNGKRVLVAGLKKDNPFTFKTIEKAKKEGEWERVSFIAFTKNKNFVKDLNTLYAQAQTVYTNSCSMCHTLHSPKEFTANQWPSIVRAMASRTAMTKEEIFLLTEYLQKHSKDIK